MKRKDLYHTKAWKDISKAYALSKHCICERCGRSVYVDGISEYCDKMYRLKYVVHHKEYLNDNNFTDKDIALGEDNLELLCIDCHNTEHKKEKPQRFDENGYLIPDLTLPMVKRF